MIFEDGGRRGVTVRGGRAGDPDNPSRGAAGAELALKDGRRRGGGGRDRVGAARALRDGGRRGGLMTVARLGGGGGGGATGGLPDGGNDRGDAKVCETCMVPCDSGEALALVVGQDVFVLVFVVRGVSRVNVGRRPSCCRHLDGGETKRMSRPREASTAPAAGRPKMKGSRRHCFYGCDRKVVRGQSEREMRHGALSPPPPF